MTHPGSRRLCAWGIGWLLVGPPAFAQSTQPYPLPPVEDTPEEILRLEDPGYGRSPVNGERLSLGEYARLSSELQEAQQVKPQISPKIKNLIFLLRVRKFLRTFLPFL